MNIKPNEFSNNNNVDNNENNSNNANNNLNITKLLNFKLRFKSCNADYIISKMMEYNNPLIFTYASPSLQNNKQFVVRALKENYKVMNYVNDVYKKDLYSLTALLSEDIDARIVEFADPAIKNDKVSMKLLVEVKVDVLLYADESLKKSKKLAMKILTNEHAPDCLKYFDPSILLKASFMQNASGKYSDELVYLAKMNDSLNDVNFIIDWAKAAAGNFDFSILNDEFKNDADFMKKLLEYDYELKFDYLGETLKNNKNFAIDIFEDNSKNLQLLKYFSEEIQNDWEVLVFSFNRATNEERFRETFRRFPNNKLELLGNKDFINFALSKNRFFHLVLNDELKNDREFALSYLKKDRLFYLLLNEELKNDPEFALIYLKESRKKDIKNLGSKLQMQLHGDFLFKIEEVNEKLYNTLLLWNVGWWTHKMECAQPIINKK